MPRRANELDGKTWTRNSISVWSDIRKSDEELRLRHPAMFPAQLVTRLLESFTSAEDQVVLDPFSGVGSTVLAAAAAGKTGIGIELNPDYAAVARSRIPEWLPGRVELHVADARTIGELLAPDSVDFVVTSPPYWNILTRKRSADAKAIRNYGEAGEDLGRIGDYEAFLESLQTVFRAVFGVLRPGKYCIVNVMDLRQGSVFYPLHCDLRLKMEATGYELDDLIIWDRRQEYNHLRPLGYPSVFRINKVHEFLLIFRKPRGR